jgi:AcrR family transcriptional regulator
VTELRSTEVLHAAEQVFGKRGHAAVTIAQIARAPGLAKGTVCLCSRSKDETSRWKGIAR